MDVPICPRVAAGHVFSVASTEKARIMTRQYNNNNNNNNNERERERERETLTFNPNLY